MSGWPHAVLVWRGEPADAAAAVPRRATRLALAGCAAIGLVVATPAEKPWPLNVSPDGRYAVLLVSDLAGADVP